MTDKKIMKQELHDRKRLRECARAFGVAGDLTRLQICWLLCRHPEMSVSDIAELLDKEVSLISHALGKLREAGVVAGRRQAKRVFYSLDKKTPAASLIKRSFT